MPTQRQPLGEQFHFWTESVPSDLLLIQRVPGFRHTFNCRVGLWWLHDLATTSQESAVLESLWQIDRILPVSEWHRRQVLETWGLDARPSGTPRAYAPTSASDWVTPLMNGIPAELLDRTPDQCAATANRVLPGRRSGEFAVLWCSRPERGLSNLLGVAARVAQTAPHVRFYLCGYDAGLARDHPLLPLYAELRRRIRSAPNVVELGSLGKADLADVMRCCDAWLYPSAFEETSCITAMEAQAAGLYCVTTDAGALPETLSGYRQHVCLPLENGAVVVDRFVEWLRSAAGSRPDRSLRRVTRTWDQVAERLIEIHAETAAGYATNDYLTDRLRHSDARFLSWLVTERFAGDSVVRGDSAPMEGVRAELGRCGIQAQNVPTPASDPRELRDHHPAVTDCARASATPHTARFVAVARYLAHRLERRGRPCRVLDYGCGRGDYTLQLADLHRAHRFVGYDAAASRIERACEEARSRNLDNVEFCTERPQGTFDVILLNDVLEHTWDVEAFVEALGAEFAHDETLWIGSTPYGARECRSRAPYDEHPMRAHHFERADLVEMLGRWLSFDITYAVASQRHGNHVFRFEGRPHVERIDYERKLQALRPRQSVSLCAILRNASGSVESMLESVRSTVDEVLIGLDRTSTDATAERLLATCRSYRIPVKIFSIDSPLVTGFDVARNATVDASVGSWILWLDGDELLLEETGLECLLRDNSWTAYAAAQTHHSDSPPGILTIDYPTRLFRRRAGCRFFGRVHEHPEIRLNAGPGRATNPPQFQISHRGYSTEPVRKARFDRNWPLMMRDRRDYPERRLGRWLWVRDLAHVNRYEQELHGGFVTAEMHRRACEGIATWEQVLEDGILRFVLEALPYYSSLVAQSGGGFEAGIAAEVNGRRQELKGVFQKREHYEKLVALIMQDQLGAVDAPRRSTVAPNGSTVRSTPRVPEPRPAEDAYELEPCYAGA